jgi:hypothetical protein
MTRDNCCPDTKGRPLLGRVNRRFGEKLLSSIDDFYA